MPTQYIQQSTSIIQLVETTIRTHWNRPAFSDHAAGDPFTYAQVAKEIKLLHGYFHQLGLRQGDRIALCDRNSSRWGIAFFAAFTFGAVVVPVLFDFNGEQIVNVLTHSESRLLICSDKTMEKIASATEQALPDACTVLNIADIGSDQSPWHTAAAEQHMKPDDMKPEDVRYFTDHPDNLALLSYTSGSTGRSKGVMIPYRAIWSNTLFADEKIGIAEGSRILSLLPMAHMYGFAFEFMYGFCLGGHVTFLTKAPSPSVLLGAFAEVRPDVVIAVPLIIEKIVRNNVFPRLRAFRMRHLLRVPFVRDIIYSKLRQRLIDVFGGRMYEVVVGGAPFSAEVEAFLKRIKFPYTVGYGMTECAPIMCYRDWKTFVKGSCGQAVPRMEVRIVSDDPAVKPGELIARGTNVMLGYYKNDEATAETIDEEGWLHSGDLATMDAEGNVFIRGRLKNMLLGANGQNIYPEEIEDKVTSAALIDECVVVQRGEKLVALVYTSDATLQAHGMSRSDLSGELEAYRRRINSMLPGFCALSQLEMRDEPFEKTPKHNIRRFLYS